MRYDGTPPSMHEITDRHPRQSASCNPYTEHRRPTDEAETFVNARATPAGPAVRRECPPRQATPHLDGEDINELVSPKTPSVPTRTAASSPARQTPCPSFIVDIGVEVKVAAEAGKALEVVW
ncbi:unnamed protein product [Cyclocybe aegerita]|uniref:Uncharacterized protein n=1 Tax=Cyclocybe aegerita TaxID=1973307 RepID=A0A8S0VWS5_CYCAE|nr:unnamed protein product [Cyclocybe aegerita]